jgi:hypothetical protein
MRIARGFIVSPFHIEARVARQFLPESSGRFIFGRSFKDGPMANDWLFSKPTLGAPLQRQPLTAGSPVYFTCLVTRFAAGR